MRRVIAAVDKEFDAARQPERMARACLSAALHYVERAAAQPPAPEDRDGYPPASAPCPTCGVRSGHLTGCPAQGWKLPPAPEPSVEAAVRFIVGAMPYGEKAREPVANAVRAFFATRPPSSDAQRPHEISDEYYRLVNAPKVEAQRLVERIDEVLETSRGRLRMKVEGMIVPAREAGLVADRTEWQLVEVELLRDCRAALAGRGK